MKLFNVPLGDFLCVCVQPVVKILTTVSTNHFGKNETMSNDTKKDPGAFVSSDISSYSSSLLIKSKLIFYSQKQILQVVILQI